MTTLDRPSFIGVTGCLASRTLHLRCSVLTCEPKYRIVRAARAVAPFKAFVHPELRCLLRMSWQAVRAHSSWSRA